MSFYYQVNATLNDEESLKKYLAWLRDGHVDMVLKWAQSADIRIACDVNGLLSNTVQSCYYFASHAAYQEDLRNRPVLF